MTARYKKAGINAFDQKDFFTVKPPKGIKKISSSLNNYADHIVTNMVDGDPLTFFWTNRAPKKGDYIKVSYEKVKSGKTLIVKTGNASTYADQLENGELQVSKDGKTWESIATFKKGSVQVKLPKGTKHVQIVCSKGQKNWLQIQDIDLR